MRVFALEASVLHIHDCIMLEKFSIILLILLTLTLPISVISASESKGKITITEYEHEDYYRSPRMEEEDRLRGKTFQFQPGLEIITDVDDAEIEFFEERMGKTPWEQDNLSPGAYRVRLERTGYEIVEFLVNVRSDRRTVVLVNMGRPTGTLFLTDLPPGAVVTVDRVPVEGNEITAAAGTHTLKVTAFGWETLQSDIEIPSGGSTRWRYDGGRRSFSLGTLKIRPRALPTRDKRGFTIEWNADSGGSADIRIISPEGRQIANIPFAVSSARGTVDWIPGNGGSEELSQGKYKVILSGTGYDSSSASSESYLLLDNRFKREARPAYAPLPGLLYAPGSAMLPRGIWQASTGAGVHFGGGIPVDIGLRFSPANRLEFSGKFKLTARDPFDATSIGMDFSTSWRANPMSGPYTVNLALLFSYEGYAADFGRIPSTNPGTSLPGLQFSIPMEYALGNWNFVLSPSVYLAFLGSNPESWQFSGPARVSESLGAGVYYEDGLFLVGASAAIRGPDYPQGFLETTAWYGLEGRFDLPGDASYLAMYTGVRTLNADPVVSLGVEFGVIR